MLLSLVFEAQHALHRTTPDHSVTPMASPRPSTPTRPRIRRSSASIGTTLGLASDLLATGLGLRRIQARPRSLA